MVVRLGDVPYEKKLWYVRDSVRRRSLQVQKEAPNGFKGPKLS